MKQQVYKYDHEGNYIEPLIIYPDENDQYDLPENCTFVELPKPAWKPVFKNGQWVETATEEEKNPVITPQPTIEETLIQMEQDVADLWYTVMMGGLA
jgi:hypothetical protein